MEEKTYCVTGSELRAIVKDVADKSSEQAVSKMFEAFGVSNDEEGRRILRSMGDSAKRASEFWEEMGTQARKGTVKLIFAVGWAIFMAGVGYIFLRAGITDKLLK